MARRHLRTLFSVLAIAISAAPASGQLIASERWSLASGGNGHIYELHRVAPGISWTDAADAAVAAGGHLATCTTHAENAFVADLVEDLQVWTPSTNGCSIGPWIGGFQPSGSPEPAGGWTWVTGEVWSDTSWEVGEPNDSCFFVEEHQLCYWNGTDAPAPQTTHTWNDYNGCVGPVIAYVVEFDAVVSVTVQLVGVNTAVSRCIRFQADDCASTDVQLSFDATGKFTGDIELPSGSSTSLCAKDRQHTLWATVPLVPGGPGYTATATLDLQGGDTDDDGDVDIHDLTWLIFQFGMGPASGGCPWDGTRDADFSGNGSVLSEDYGFQTANWLATSDCDCTVASTWEPGERLERKPFLRVHDTISRVADLNGDGWVDHVDARMFEDVNGLPHDLSETMRVATPSSR